MRKAETKKPGRPVLLVAILICSAIAVATAVWENFSRYAAASHEQIESGIRRKLLNDMKFLQRATSRNFHLGNNIASIIAGKVDAVISPGPGDADSINTLVADALKKEADRLPGKFEWVVFDVNQAKPVSSALTGNELKLASSSGGADPQVFEIARLLATRGLGFLADSDLSDEFRKSSGAELQRLLDDKTDVELSKFVSTTVRCFQSCFIVDRQFHFMWLPIVIDRKFEESAWLARAAKVEGRDTMLESGGVAGMVGVMFDEDNFKIACNERFENALIENFRKTGCHLALSSRPEDVKSGLTNWLQDGAFAASIELAETRSRRLNGIIRAGKWLRTETVLPDLNNRIVVLAREAGKDRPAVVLMRRLIFLLLLSWMVIIVYFCGNHLLMRRAIAVGLRLQLVVLVAVFLLPAFLLALISLERYLDSTRNSEIQKLRQESEEALEAFDKSIKLYRTRLCSLADNLIDRADASRDSQTLSGSSGEEKKSWLGSFLKTFISNGVVMKNILLINQKGEIVSRLVGSNKSEEKFFQQLGSGIFLPTLNAMNPDSKSSDDENMLLKAQTEEILEMLSSVLLPEIFPAMSHTYSHLTRLEGFGDQAFLYHRFLGSESAVNGALLVAVYPPSIECVAFNRWINNFSETSFRPIWLIKKKIAPDWFLKAPFGRVSGGGKFGFMRFVFSLLPAEVSYLANMSTQTGEVMVTDFFWNGRSWLYATLPGRDLIDYQLSALIPLTGHFRDFENFQTELRLAMLLIFLLCGYIGWKMAAGFVLPVRRFAETAEKLMDGDLAVRMQDSWADEEFRQIACEFNLIAADVENGRILRKFVSDGALQAIVGSEKIDLSRSVQSRLAVVMFLRIEGFMTSSAEKDPTRAVAELNRFFSAVCSSVRQAGGEVSKFIAEKAMTTFFIEEPGLMGGQAAAALNAAMSVIERLSRHRLLEQNCRVRVGIATGTVRSGIIGSETTRLEQTVIGDSVNLAARLCSHAGEHEILICGNTFSALIAARSLTPEQLESFVQLPPQHIKGKRHAVDIFSVKTGLYIR